MDTDHQGDKPADQGKSKPTRPRKPKPADQGKGKRSLNLSLDQDTYQRLATHALADDRTMSDIVAELVNTHLRRVHLTRTTTTRPE